MKITGIKKAVGDYKRANAGGVFSPRYGKMMLDRSTGEVWTDEFYSIGQNSWKEYHDEAVINLIAWAAERSIGPVDVTMANVKHWAEEAIAQYA